VYGLGKAEIELSKALGSFRKDAFIITKFGVRWEKSNFGGRAFTYMDSSPSYLIKALHDSLKRLKIDAIPLYLIHWPDNKINIEETIIALEKVKSEGKIMNYGISNFFSESTFLLFNDFNISAFQGPINLIDYKKSDLIFKQAKKQNITTFSYSPLAQGLFTGKYDSSSRFDQSDRRHRLIHFQPEHWEKNNKILNILNKLSIKYNRPISQIAIRWVIDNCKIDSVVVSAKNVDQVDSNIDSLEFTLQQEDIDKLNISVGYPAGAACN